jgi:hypothetical protein
VGVISRLYTHGLHADDLCLRPLGSPAITRRIVLMVRSQPQLRRSTVTDCLEHLARALRGRRAATASR